MIDKALMPALFAAAALALMPGSVLRAQQDGHGAGSPPDSEAALAVVERLRSALIDAAALDSADERVAALTEQVAATHDLSYIAELTVRRQWRGWTAQQRADFEAAFGALSVMSYATRFADVAADSFAVIDAEPAAASRVQVTTRITRADGSGVPLDFVLQQDAEAHWRIVNVIADGVSDIALKRAQYRAVLDESGFAGLIEDIAAHTAELAAGAGQ